MKPRAPRIAVLTIHEHEQSNPQVLYLAAALQSNGAEVTVVGPLGPTACNFLRMRSIGVRRISVPWPMRRAPRRALPRLGFLAWYSCLLTWYLLLLLVRLPSSVDLILAVEQTPCRASWFLRRIGRARAFACYMLEIWTHWLSPPDIRGSLNRMVWKECDLFILSNEERRRLFEEVFPTCRGRTAVLHNVQPLTWPGREIRSVSELTAPLKVGYVGSIYRATALDRLIEAVAPCRHPVQLLIAGAIRDAAYFGEIAARARELGIEDRIEFLGPVDRRRIPDVIEQCHVTVCFYPWRTGSVDINFKFCAPNKIYESLALGRPVVASDNPTLLFLSDLGVGWNMDIEKTEQITELLDDLSSHLDAVAQAGARARLIFLDKLNFEVDSESVVNAILRTARHSPSSL